MSGQGAACGACGLRTRATSDVLDDCLEDLDRGSTHAQAAYAERDPGGRVAAWRFGCAADALEMAASRAVIALAGVCVFCWRGAQGALAARQLLARGVE